MYPLIAVEDLQHSTVTSVISCPCLFSSYVRSDRIFLLVKAENVSVAIYYIIYNCNLDIVFAVLAYSNSVTFIYCLTFVVQLWTV